MTNYLIVPSKGAGLGAGAGGDGQQGEERRAAEEFVFWLLRLECRDGPSATWHFPCGVPLACCLGPDDICS